MGHTCYICVLWLQKKIGQQISPLHPFDCTFGATVATVHLICKFFVVVATNREDVKVNKRQSSVQELTRYTPRNTHSPYIGQIAVKPEAKEDFKH